MLCRRVPSRVPSRYLDGSLPSTWCRSPVSSPSKGTGVNGGGGCKHMDAWGSGAGKVLRRAGGRSQVDLLVSRGPQPSCSTAVPRLAAYIAERQLEVVSLDAPRALSKFLLPCIPARGAAANA